MIGVVEAEDRKIRVYDNVEFGAFCIVDSAYPEVIRPVEYPKGDEDARELAKNEAFALALQMADDRYVSPEAVEYDGAWSDR